MKRGRPKETDNPVRVSLRLSAVHYDWFCALASRKGWSVPKTIRLAAISVLKNGAQATTSAQ